jgi:hypothetical protein
MLGFELRVLHMLSKHSTIELNPQSAGLLWNQCNVHFINPEFRHRKISLTEAAKLNGKVQCKHEPLSGTQIQALSRTLVPGDHTG